MNYVLGIDPGLNGALAIVSQTTKALIEVVDMPLSKKTKEVDPYAVSSFLEKYCKKIKFAVIEDVGVMTGREGRVSMFNFGVGAGIFRGAIASFRIPIYFVQPSVWKSLMNLDRNKETSLAKARVKFPTHTDYFNLKKHDGRAEAALIALFGAERFR